MKKLLLILMLFTVMVLNGCTNGGTETDQEYDDLQAEQDDQQIEEDEPEIEEDDAQEEEDLQEEQDDPPVEDSLLTEAREFDVASGEHGYLAVQWIEHMNDYLPNRLAFSDRELETAEWLVETLLEMGFDESQVEMQTFSYDGETSSWWGNATMMIQMYESMGDYDGLERIDYSQNVILTIPGRSTETIIMGAHYDGVGNPGMSDNAGGTVLLLENAYRMRDIDHYYTLQYVFFGAEEVGLIGAFHFVDHMTQEEIDNLILMINADVIMDGPNLVYSIGYIDKMPAYPMDLLWELPDISQNALSEQVKETADQLNAEQNTELISKPSAINTPSDQLAFIQFGIPVMIFYSTHPVDYPELAPDDAWITDLFIGDVLHTDRDCLDYLVANHPGRVERALHEFGLFLEELASSEFVQ